MINIRSFLFELRSRAPESIESESLVHHSTLYINKAIINTSYDILQLNLFDHLSNKSMASLNPDDILALSSSSRAYCVMRPHPSQPWEVRPQSLGWVRMGHMGILGTWYMVYGAWYVVEFQCPNQHQELNMDMRG